MTTQEQIENILYDFIGLGGGDGNTIREYAEKIVALTADNGAATAAAALENEVTSTLMDMLAATVLATLIEEQGGGRSNIRYSPVSMEHMMKNYSYTVENEGLTRNVRIHLKPGSESAKEFESYMDPAKEGVMRDNVSAGVAKPQAQVKDHDRPLWVIAAHGPDGSIRYARCHDRADAEREIRQYHPDLSVHIENRFCLHPECPSSVCHREKK